MKRSLLLTAAAFAAASLPARGQSGARVLQIGASPQDAYAEAYYGVDLGFFQRAGLNVNLQTFASGSAAAPAVSGGSIDISVTTPIQIAEARDPGRPLRDCRGRLAEHGARTRCAGVRGQRQPDSQCQGSRGEGCRAEHAAHAHASRAHVVAHQVGRTWNGSTVEVTVGKWPQLSTRDHCGGTPQEPFMSAALRTGTVRVLATHGGNRTALPSGCLVFDTEFVPSQPELVNRFASAMYETGRWANAITPRPYHPPKYSKLNPETVRRQPFGIRRAPLAADPALARRRGTLWPSHTHHHRLGDLAALAMIIIDNDTVTDLLTAKDCIEAQDAAFRGLASGRSIRGHASIYYPCERPDGYFRWGTMEAQRRLLRDPHEVGHRHVAAHTERRLDGRNTVWNRGHIAA